MSLILQLFVPFRYRDLIDFEVLLHCLLAAPMLLKRRPHHGMAYWISAQRWRHRNRPDGQRGDRAGHLQRQRRGHLGRQDHLLSDQLSEFASTATDYGRELSVSQEALPVAGLLCFRRQHNEAPPPSSALVQQ